MSAKLETVLRWNQVDIERRQIHLLKTKNGETNRLEAEIAEQRKLKFELQKMRMRGELTREEFEHSNAEFTVGIYAIEERLREAASRHSTTASFVRFAELQLADMATVWKMAGAEQRQKVQNLLFEDGLSYCPERGILNRSKSSLFSMLGLLNGRTDWLVGPPGLEPGTNGL